MLRDTGCLQTDEEKIVGNGDRSTGWKVDEPYDPQLSLSVLVK